MNIQSTIKRSLVKTISYRILIVVTNGLAAYLLTGRWDVALSIGAVTAILNTVLYYANERVWNRINWGKRIIA